MSLCHTVPQSQKVLRFEAWMESTAGGLRGPCSPTCDRLRAQAAPALALGYALLISFCSSRTKVARVLLPHTVLPSQLSGVLLLKILIIELVSWKGPARIMEPCSSVDGLHGDGTHKLTSTTCVTTQNAV